MSSDINLSNLLFSKTPTKWHPYIKLSRIDRPIGIWLLLLPCWWGIVLAEHNLFDMTMNGWRDVILVLLGAILMRSAGCVINDIWDKDLDAQVERTKTRPLPAGEISTRHAFRFVLALMGLSLLILLMLSKLAIILGIASIALVVAYPYMKRITWWPQLFLGLTFNWGALLGYAAITDTITIPAVFLYIGGIFWTLGYDTIYAHQDKEDDALIGIKSTALKFGSESKKYVAMFYGAALFFILAAKFNVSPTMVTPMLAALPLGFIIWKLKNWDMNDPQSCLETFRANQYFGLLVLLMLAV